MIEAPAMPKLDLISILTGETCGEACWHAKEDICRCSCGGKNHGILRNGNADMPERTCRHKDKMFKLAGLYPYWSEANESVWELSHAYNKEHGLPEYIESAYLQSANGHTLKWTEIENYASANNDDLPYLVWVKV